MATQDSRIKIKRSTITATVPTVPSSNDHTDGTWTATDIYKGELFFNQADGVLWSRDDNGVTCLGGSASVELTPAQVLALNTTPITIVGAVSGYAIEVVVSASVKIDFGTTAYATNTFIQLIGKGATTAQYGASVLNATVATTKKLPEISTTSATTTQLITNAALQVSTLTGDPTTGDSTVTVYVNYRLIPA
ncbi:MAG: hypothetical protein ACYS26_22510, partial [Planctomycetota bacterium]|jgi:hypothetical protein